nr:MAG TPA: DNA-directed RNA polymerase subunit D [Caudoviricetes sp.]
MNNYRININNNCNQCMECVEVCQSGILTSEFINMVKHKINCTEHPDEIYFRELSYKCTYCESCVDVCDQKAIWIINPEYEELQ